ncbi:hypothetical protein GETHPA_22300 [Geothrix rubra]|uniref:Uncharacterized protein n=1 Tax=Geothrix rubra TaxID=2927977 RepID=A0ABQ5Q7Z0_9BACT|nr:hypothetical protein GETHPA_22300 [Geothrix rubra]
MPMVHPAPRTSRKVMLGVWIATATGFLIWVLLG